MRDRGDWISRIRGFLCRGSRAQSSNLRKINDLINGKESRYENERKVIGKGREGAAENTVDVESREYSGSASFSSLLTSQSH